MARSDALRPSDFTLGINMMDRAVSTLMNTHITAVDMDDTIDTVEKKMDSNKLSCCALVIDSKQGCFGVITYPDIVHFYEMGRNAKSERAWELCTHKVVAVSPDTSARETAALMVKHKIHHIVILENKQIKGVVSSMDFVREYLKQNA
ncbi:MAG: CBS domain-containing protein [Methylobacter sp.]|jgi:signal-transduction protein with cAMP-binding, CBS, and nucleotidyltransferase domain|nr:CBS domain-containing protein [Methylobacter sp.]